MNHTGRAMALPHLAALEWGDAYTLQELRTRFEKGPVDWAALSAKRNSTEASHAVKGSE